MLQAAEMLPGSSRFIHCTNLLLLLSQDFPLDIREIRVYKDVYYSIVQQGTEENQPYACDLSVTHGYRWTTDHSGKNSLHSMK